jgi:diguanylate cyclase (GGDEF)-like protein
VTLPEAPVLVVHERPADDEAGDLLAAQRVMLWLRLVGVAVVLSQGWQYKMLTPVLLWLAVGIEAVVVTFQGRLLAGERPIAQLRRRSTLLLAADLVAVYLIGTMFTADPQWAGFYLYPLIAFEAALIAGVWAGLGVTLLSVIVYLAQLVLHEYLGLATELRSALAAISLIAMTGAFMAVYAHVAGRRRDHLRAMLSLTSALARHEHQADAIHHLDRRLHDALGARVRSVAVRDPASGGFRVLAWRTSEERTLTPTQLRRAFGDPVALAARLEAGQSVTYETNAWSVITATLGLPEWAASVTLVPIVAEGRWVGVLPVLWPTRTTPDRAQLGLLNGLAGQLGLALGREELERMRRSATVDSATGLLNRRAVSAELGAFVARAERSNGRLAVLLLEISRGGPTPGADEATIRAVAAAARDVLRGGDVAGRQDDDRLLVIAANADVAAARSLGHRIERAVASVPSAAACRLAIGIAAYPQDGPTAADLVEAADAAIETAVPRVSVDTFLGTGADEAALA